MACATKKRLTYCIAATFEGENFHEFRGFLGICESFLSKLRGVASFGAAKVSNLQKIICFTKVFSLERFPLYIVPVFVNCMSNELIDSP